MAVNPVPPVALLTYSTKPRGGVVHTLALADALHDLGHDVLVVGLGDPAEGFFRPTRAPVTIVPAPAAGASLEEKVERNTAALASALVDVAAGHPILHAQDCIAARAVTRSRAAGTAAGALTVSVRTVHHVDDFSSAVLMDCQRQAIIEPDVVLTVSRHWRDILAAEYGVQARVVHNGVDVERFRDVRPELARSLRARVTGPDGRDRPVLLSVGGIEPRKGSVHLVRALAMAAPELAVPPVLAVLGGHSFQDHRPYRESVLAELPGLGLALGRDVVELGTVPDEEMPGWYAAADALAFPSTKEGFGLAVLEAMSAGLPVVTSDLPAFQEYLRGGVDVLMVPVGDEPALAAALVTLLRDDRVREGLRAAGARVARRFTWPAAAAEHASLYAELAAGSDRPGGGGG